MIGKTISHYKILEKLGEGGMGVVYKALDTRLNREVAIKFLPHHIAPGEEERKRFKIEAQAAAALNHPNIATIYAVEEVDRETFIVMEYIKGRELKDNIQANLPQVLNLREVLEYATQIAEGLQAAHDEGVIHRDIKSGNIMITEKGQVKIMDFGLAKVRGGEELTKEHSTLGTAAYMSPEQALGKKDIDHRTDIWSLGVVFYEMLTGELPFKGEYPQAIIYSVLNVEPEPIIQVQPDVSVELELIITNCLQKDLSLRYQTSLELSKDIQAFSKKAIDSKIQSKPGKGKLKKNKLTLFKKIILAFSTIIALIIVILAWYIYPFLYVPEPIQHKNDKSIAVLYFDNMSSEEDEYFADGLTEELISRLSRIKNLNVTSRTDAKIYKSKPATVTEIGKELHVDYIVEGSVRKAGNEIRITAQLINVNNGFHRWTETYNRQLTDIFIVQDDVAVNIAQRLDIEISNRDKSAISVKPTENLEAYNLVLQAKHRAITLGFMAPDSVFNNIHSMLERAVELDPQYVEAVSYLGASYLEHLALRWYKLDNEGRNRLMKKALEATQRALSLEPKNEVALTILPLTFMMKTGAPSTEKTFQPFRYRNIKISINKLFKYYPESAMAHYALGSYFKLLKYTKLPIRKKNELQIAIGHFQRALEISNSILKSTPNDPITMYIAYYSYWEIGIIYYGESRYQDALTHLLRVHQIEIQNNNWKEEGSTAYWLGIIYFYLGEYDKAITYFMNSANVLDILGNETLLGDNYLWIGLIYSCKEEYDKAFENYMKAKNVYQELGDKYLEANALRDLGIVKFRISDYDKAHEYFKLAYEAFAATDNNAILTHILSYWALCQIKLNNIESAKDKVEQAEKMLENNKFHPEGAVIVKWNLAKIYLGLSEEEKYEKFLEKAYKQLMDYSNTCKDKKARESLLKRFSELVSEWEEITH